MDIVEVIRFLRKEIEPMPDNIYGNRYRVAAYLNDGTYLPCVVLQSKERQVNLAIRRLTEEKMRRLIVEAFVTGGARVNEYDLQKVEVSRYAWPLKVLKGIHGETVMGWTAFVVEMHDGKRFSCGTSFVTEFLDLPEGYSHSDIKAVHSGMIYSDAIGMQPFNIRNPGQFKTYTHKPYFTCYIDGIDS